MSEEKIIEEIEPFAADSDVEELDLDELDEIAGGGRGSGKKKERAEETRTECRMCKELGKSTKKKPVYVYKYKDHTICLKKFHLYKGKNYIGLDPLFAADAKSHRK